MVKTIFLPAFSCKGINKHEERMLRSNRPVQPEERLDAIEIEYTVDSLARAFGLSRSRPG